MSKLKGSHVFCKQPTLVHSLLLEREVDQVVLTRYEDVLLYVAQTARVTSYFREQDCGSRALPLISNSWLLCEVVQLNAFDIL